VRLLVEYDVAVVHSFASRLLLRANLVVWLSTLVGIAVGIGLMLATARLVLLPAPERSVVYSVLAGVAGCLGGWLVGSFQADRLRLNAQIALCLVEIVGNPPAEEG
jgi:hypothetical protein